MPDIFRLAGFTVLALAIAGAANADKLLFSGTHTIRFSHNGVIKQVEASGTGVAVANKAAGGPSLNTLELTRAFAKINETISRTPGEVGIDLIQFENVRIHPVLAGPKGAPGVFAPIQAAAKGGVLTRSTLPAAGTIVLCNLFTCGASVAVKLDQTNMGVAIGPGVGGTFMATGMSGTKQGLTKVTVMGNPWTVNTTTVSYRDAMGAIMTLMSAGTAKGPLGKIGTTLDQTTMGMGGTLQLVSGIQTTCSGCGGNNSPSGQITRITINFAPEPGQLVLLAAGALGVALLGRTRGSR